MSYFLLRALPRWMLPPLFTSRGAKVTRCPADRALLRDCRSPCGPHVPAGCLPDTAGPWPLTSPCWGHREPSSCVRALLRGGLVSGGASEHLPGRAPHHQRQCSFWAMASLHRAPSNVGFIYWLIFHHLPASSPRDGCPWCVGRGLLQRLLHADLCARIWSISGQQMFGPQRTTRITQGPRPAPRPRASRGTPAVSAPLQCPGGAFHLLQMAHGLVI